jgi:hypothetical protein
MRESRYFNPRADRKLSQITEHVDLNSPANDLTLRSKINLSYLDTKQEPSSDFKDLSKEVLCDILVKIKEHGKKSLEELQRTAIGGGPRDGKRGNILKIYGDFPPNQKTDFKEPTYIPDQVKWGTIRITGAIRLVGFIIPPTYHGNPHVKTKERFDKNTFYVVFIDTEHKFWKCEK